MKRSWWPKAAHRLPRKSRRPAAFSPRPRLSFELLEDRITPSITATNQSVGFIEGASNPVVVATFTDNTPSPTGNYTASIDWGDGTVNPGTVSLDQSTDIYSVTGSHAYLEETPIGSPQLITVSIAETTGDLDSATAHSTGTVADAALSPQPITFSPDETVAFSGRVGSFTDADPNGTASDYTATIVWGDGTTTAGTVSANGSGGFDVTGTHTYAEDGTYAVRVNVVDAGGASAMIASTANVAETDLVLTAGSPITATEGSSVSATLATFTDGPGIDPASNYAASIQWGDGTTTPGTVSGPLGGVYSITGTHTFQDEINAGTILITLTETGIANATRTATTSLVVFEGDSLVASSVAITATEGTQYSGPVATFTDSLTTTPASDFSATIDWGDGTTSQGTVTGSNGNFTVNGTHTYADEFNGLSVQVTIRDDAPGTATATVASTATVLEGDVLSGTAVAINAVEGAAFSGIVGNFSTSLATSPASDFSATIDWGDGTTSSGTVSGTNGNFTVAGTHTYAEDGNYTLSVTLSDDAPGTAAVSATATVAVDEADLLLTSNNFTATEGTSFTNQLVATFTDGMTPDGAGAFAANIDWGDGTTSTGTITGPVAGVFGITGSHTYLDEGTFSATITLNEIGVGNSTRTATDLVTVVEGDVLAGINGSAAGVEQTPLSLSASFTDTNTTNIAADFTASIQWGDGTSTTSALVSGSNGNFTVSAQHSYQDEGTFFAVVTLTDDAPGTATASATITVTVGEGDAFSGSAVNFSTVEQFPFSGTVATFTDTLTGTPASDLQATIDWGDGTTSLGSVSGGSGTFSVAGTHTYAEDGNYVFSVTLRDNAPGTATATTSGTATVGEQQLSLSSNAATATEGIAFGGTLGTLDDPGTLDGPGAFTATIDWGDGTTSSGVLVGPIGGPFGITGTHTYSDEGTFTFRLTAYETFDPSFSISVQNTITVLEGDVLTPVPIPFTVQEGNATPATVASFTDSNLTAVASDFTATIQWGDGTSSTGTVSGGAGTFSVSGSHVYLDEGNYSVTVQVADDAPGTATTTISSTATVTEGDVLIPASIPAINGTEGQNSSGTVATFSDSNLSALASDFSATINWGDGTTSPGTVTGGAGTFSVSGSHLYTEEGLYPLSVSIRDDAPGTATATAMGTATIANAPLTLTGNANTAIEGTPLVNITVATFIDTGGPEALTDYTASIDWGDGSTSTGTILAGTNNFYVLGSHSYTEEGTYPVNVSVTDDAGGTMPISASTATSILVADAILTPTAGSGVTGVEGAAIAPTALATFTDAGGPESTANYTAQVIWGDGSTSTGTITLNGNTFTVSDGHTYAEEGTFSIQIVITDDGGSQVSVLTSATVADAALTATGTPVAATEGLAFTGTVATFTDADPNGVFTDYTASIQWGDGTTTTGVVSSGMGGFVVSGTHTYAEEGSFPVSVQVNDIGGSSASATSTATVADAALTGSAVAATPVEGASFTGTVAAFTDADPGGTLSDYSATIDWGDGTTSTGTIGSGATGFVVSGTHTYAEEGNSTIRITIQDVGGSSVVVTNLTAVADAPLTGTAGAAINAVEGVATSATLASFTDADPNGAVTDYSATIDWGDGSTSAGTIAASGNGFTVSGSHTFGEEGTNAIAVTIRDAGGSQTVVHLSASVTDTTITLPANPIVVPNGTTLASSVIATFTEMGGGPEPANSFSAVVDWGDGGASQATVAAAGNSFTVTGGHTFVAPGRYSVKITVAEVGGGTTTATTTAVVGNINERFVAQVYRDLLGRQPDPTGLSVWSGMLAGGTSKQQVVEAIEASPEYLTLLVEGLYEEYLHRAADSFGLGIDVSFLAHGGTIEQVRGIIVGSPEYFQNRAGGTNAGYLQALYQDALGRAPDPIGAAAFTSLLNAGATRQQVADIIFTSDEYRQDLVTSYYQSYLHRNPDSFGLNAFVSLMRAGTTDQEVIAIIMSSNEYASLL